MRRAIGAILLLFVLAAASDVAQPGLASSGPQILAAQAVLAFPDTITFEVQTRSDASIVAIELEYGLEARSCVTDINKASPEAFIPAPQVATEWVWDMRRTGSLPPGARLWWQWRVVDEAGREVRSERQTLTWLDDVHPWKSLEGDGVTLHWYRGDEAFARELLAAAEAALARMQRQLGAALPGGAQIFIYADTQALQEAVLFEPGWTGGLAFGDYDVVLLGVGPNELDWGLEAIAHEMTHLAVGELVDACYSSLPTWLSEGLAVYAEGGLDADSQAALQEAIANDELYSVRSLSDGFTEHPGRASLSYAQSYSLVAFLIDTYGPEKMVALLQAFDQGYRYDHALEKVYGFDADSLETAWRESVGAPRPQTQGALPGTPTPVPTVELLAAPPVAATATPRPTSLPSDEAGERGASSPGRGLAIIALLLCGFGGVLLGMAISIVVVSRRLKRRTE